MIEDDNERLTDPTIIPAQPGWFEIWFYLSFGADTASANEEDVLFSKRPIIAWSVQNFVNKRNELNESYDVVTMVTPSGDRGKAWILDPTGIVHYGVDAGFGDMNAARREWLIRERSERK